MSKILFFLLAISLINYPHNCALAQTSPNTSSNNFNSTGLDGNLAKGNLNTDRPVLNTPLLKGSVSHSKYEDQVLIDEKQAIPSKTKVDLILNCNLNSEISHVGDEVIARIASNVGTGLFSSLPGNWYIKGKVTQVMSPKRLGRNGYVSVEFSQIISPDGAVNLPFNCRFSTRDKKLVAVTKILATDSVYVTKGAIAGAILSTQMTGIPLAIASHGYSVAIGAGLGAGLGLFAALKRKGEVTNLYPTDEIKLVTSEQIAAPTFLPSPNASLPSLKNLPKQPIELIIKKYYFNSDPLGDKKANLLTLNLTVNNLSKRQFSFYDFVVISDHNQLYYPAVMSQFKELNKKIQPNSSNQATISFSVDSRKRKYFLVLLDKVHEEELKRISIN